MLAHLAELYECRVADLLVDGADFSHRDHAQLARRLLDDLPLDQGCSTLGEVSPGTELDFRALAELLGEIDMHELARLSVLWAQQDDGTVNRRALLLKLGAGLTLAASTPAIANAEPDLVESTVSASGEGALAGVWHSKYVYYSDGRAAQFEGEHHVSIHGSG